MDFVVVGFGLGALGVLLGVVMLGWLAPRAQQAAARTSSSDDAARCQAIAAEHRGTGQAFVYAGGGLLLATVAALAGSLDDRTGALLVTATATVAAVGILLAGFIQRSKNPVPPRRRTRSAPVASASIVTAPAPIDIPSFLAGEPPRVHGLAVAESDVEEPHAETIPTSDLDREAIVAQEMAPRPPAANGAISSTTPDPELRGDSPVAAEATGSRTRQLADHGAGNGSGDEEFAEIEESNTVGHVAPVAGATESSSVQPDEEDPSSGNS